VLARNPEAGSALLNLVKLDLALGRTTEAREALTSWLTRHPGDAAARRLLEQVGKK
jgi:TolA-binding protein